LEDYNFAETKGFGDMCALLLSGGSVKRLLLDVEGALEDFTRVLAIISERDLVSGLKSRVFVLIPRSNSCQKSCLFIVE
jgi:hypothetical protein